MKKAARPAAFLDRDGTLIRDVNFIGRPEQVELIPGAAAAVRRLNKANIPAVVITNQSGIARGYFSEADYAKVHEHMLALLARDNARLDAAYHCPHHPDVGGPCECRKPGTLLYRRAIADHGLDGKASWFIGDRLRDVLPAQEFGGHGIMVPSDQTPLAELERGRKEFIVVESLDAAIARVIESAR